MAEQEPLQLRGAIPCWSTLPEQLVRGGEPRASLGDCGDIGVAWRHAGRQLPQLYPAELDTWVGAERRSAYDSNRVLEHWRDAAALVPARTTPDHDAVPRCE